MASIASRVGLMAACLALVLPPPAFAGSSQANLAVSVTVPARCALRVAGPLASDLVMKCTKGTLPSGGDASAPRRASAVEPRISREVVTSAVPAILPAPRELTESGLVPGPGGLASSLVVTVNF